MSAIFVLPIDRKDRVYCFARARGLRIHFVARSPWPRRALRLMLPFDGSLLAVLV